MSENSNNKDKRTETFDPHFKPIPTSNEPRASYDPHFGNAQFDPAASQKHDV